MDSGIGVSVISRDDDIAIVYIKNPPAKMGIAYYVFNALAEAGIDVDIILQTSTSHIRGDIIFTVHQIDVERTKEVFAKEFADSSDTEIEIDTDAVKLMVSGVGMQGKPGVAAKVFRCLWDAGVQIINISTSEIKISMLIRTADAERATDALYKNFDIVL